MQLQLGHQGGALTAALLPRGCRELRSGRPHAAQQQQRRPRRSSSSSSSSSTTSGHTQQQRPKAGCCPCGDEPAPAAAGPAREQPTQLQRLAAVPLALLPAAVLPGAAVAATVCFEVPDALADWRGTLLHSPFVAVGVTAACFIIFPRLIRTAINYLALPAIMAILLFLAVSNPETTADTLFSVLEFVKEHPAASSVAIVVAGGVLLGPDLLAGAAVTGVLVLLAVQAGMLQLPKLPSLPRLPGSALLSRQIDRAGQALRDRLDNLDDDDDDDSSSSSSARSVAQRARQQPRLLAEPRPAPAVQVQEAAPSPPLPPPPQQPQQQQAPPGLPVPASAADGGGGFGGLARQLGSASKAFGAKAWEQGRALQGSDTVQQLRQQTAQAAAAAAEGFQRAGEQVRGSDAVQQTAKAAARAADAAKQSTAGLLGARSKAQQPARAPEPPAPAGRTAEQAAERDIDAVLSNS